MFAKLVSFVLILIGLWSLFRFVGRFDRAKKGADTSARRSGARKQAQSQSRASQSREHRSGSVVEAKPMVQCSKCQVFHEAGRRCPDCYPKG